MISRYSLPEFDVIWSQKTKYENWLTVEVMACEAMEAAGIVPVGTSEKIVSKLPSIIDISKIEQLEETTKHDLVAFLQYIEEKVGPDARWLHYGLTSSDIVDTSFSIALLNSYRIINNYLHGIVDVLRYKIKETSHVAMIGRTHGMHAELITFGLMLARHLAEFKRNILRLENTKTDLAVGKLSGAVGTYAHSNPEIERVVLKELGLNPAIGSTQVIARDRYAAFFMELSLIAVAIERLAINIRHLQRNEVSEVHEGFTPDQKGSSAMPHKQNPILSENLCGLSRYVRGLIIPVLENCVLWHERDISHSSVERFVAPDITSTVGFMLHRAIGLIQNLVVDKEQIGNNLKNSRFWYSEAILLALISAGLTRKESHDIVQEMVSKASKTQIGQLLGVVLTHSKVRELISNGKLNKDDLVLLCSPECALRHVDRIIEDIDVY